MATLQIPNVDQRTLALLGRLAADHGRSVEDEALIVLQRVAMEADAELPRGPASLKPMTLSPEDAELMHEAWENGRGRPTLPVVSLPQYEG